MLAPVLVPKKLEMGGRDAGAGEKFQCVAAALSLLFCVCTIDYGAIQHQILDHDLKYMGLGPWMAKLLEQFFYFFGFSTPKSSF
jgi:hypothetical protein